jgi:putative lipoprotein
MNTKKQTLLFNVFVSMGIAAMMFILAGVIIDRFFHGNIQMTNYAFSKMAIATVVIGLGFGLPAVVYDNEKLSLFTQTIIHMGTGCIVMTVTAFLVGWIPMHHGPLLMIAILLEEIALAFVIWFVFYLQQKKLVKQMNQRVNEINKL